MESETYDVVVVGGGAAGLSAALVLGRARRRVAVIDAGTPRNAPAAQMHGFLSRDGMAPEDLLATARAEVRSYGVELVDDRVVEVTSGFMLRLAGGRLVAARQLLLATGAVDELPDIPGVRERWGRDFLHCPYCHGWEVRDQPIGVLGMGLGSVDHAHLLRQWSDDVIFFAHTYPVTANERTALDARGVPVIDGRVARFSVVDDRLNAVELTDGRAIPRAAVFIRPALRAHNDGLIESLGCEVDEGGFIRVDATGRTSVPGVWVAGNAGNPRAQVITAAGEGSAAAIAINAHLVEEDVRNALQSVTASEQAATESTDTERISDDQHHREPACPDSPTQQASTRSHDLAVRLPDADGHQPGIRGLAPNDVAGASHLRARNDRGPDRDLRIDAVPAPAPRAPDDDQGTRGIALD